MNAEDRQFDRFSFLLLAKICFFGLYLRVETRIICILRNIETLSDYTVTQLHQILQHFLLYIDSSLFSEMNKDCSQIGNTIPNSLSSSDKR